MLRGPQQSFPSAPDSVTTRYRIAESEAPAYGPVRVVTTLFSNQPKRCAPVASTDSVAPSPVAVKVPVAPKYFPVPPVTTPVSVKMNGKGDVEKSSHNVAEVPLVNKRSPVAVKR